MLGRIEVCSSPVKSVLSIHNAAAAGPLRFIRKSEYNVGVRSFPHPRSEVGMKKVIYPLLVFSLAFSLGCSCLSTVERENLVELCDREEFVGNNPESRFCDNILSGEIVRGMEGNEVMASWGLPNVYLVSEDRTREFWVYYVQNVDTISILIYTLSFDDRNILDDWDIDIKRFSGGSYVYSPDAIVIHSKEKHPVGKK